MNLDIISYKDLAHPSDSVKDIIQTALYTTGIVGVKDVPQFVEKSKAYIEAARQFSSLSLNIKKQYAPDRDAGLTEGYELGAEQFLDQNGQWQTDDKKVSFYAFVPDHKRNQWPNEIDIKTPYLDLGELMFETGKKILDFMGLNEGVGLPLDHLVGYGRMLHYLADDSIQNPNWCGAHLDHGVLTALMPAYYFRNGIEIDEPQDVGLYIMPSNSERFEKIDAADKSIMLFQVGEFLQLASNDRIRATKHLVKKTTGSVERFTFALFFSAQDDTAILSHSELTQDTRYLEHKSSDGSICYGKWEAASYERYRAI